MNTKRAPRVRFGVLATAVAAFGSLSVAGSARAEQTLAGDQSQAQVVFPHQGPGVGSVKTPPFYDAAYQAYLLQQNQANSKRYFHSMNGQPVSWMYPVGPGPWSPKAPGDH
jgi:hypothetical protein